MGRAEARTAKTGAVQRAVPGVQTVPSLTVSRLVPRTLAMPVLRRRGAA
eukprot:SAG11_NODE_30254_length_302_cov_1.591133_2_plen_48_part_01